jgi:hypothetical protein
MDFSSTAPRYASCIFSSPSRRTFLASFPLFSPASPSAIFLVLFLVSPPSAPPAVPTDIDPLPRAQGPKVPVRKHDVDRVSFLDLVASVIDLTTAFGAPLPCVRFLLGSCALMSLTACRPPSTAPPLALPPASAGALPLSRPCAAAVNPSPVRARRSCAASTGRRQREPCGRGRAAERASARTVRGHPWRD